MAISMMVAGVGLAAVALAPRTRRQRRRDVHTGNTVYLQRLLVESQGLTRGPRRRQGL